MNLVFPHQLFAESQLITALKKFLKLAIVTTSKD